MSISNDHKKGMSMHAAMLKFKCYLSDQGHAIYRCAKFLDVNLHRRQVQVEN